jgi:hypothetical protein
MAGMIVYLEKNLLKKMRFIVLDVTERLFRFIFFSIVAHVKNLDKDIYKGCFCYFFIMEQVGNFRNKIHPTTIKINDIFRVST